LAFSLGPVTAALAGAGVSTGVCDGAFPICRTSPVTGFTWTNCWVVGSVWVCHATGRSGFPLPIAPPTPLINGLKTSPNAPAWARNACAFRQRESAAFTSRSACPRAASCSRRTLETLFQKELRRSVHRTLLELRLRDARHLLQTTTDTVESIAADTGFCHAPHLYREFKRWTGLTPRAWRKINGSGETTSVL